MHDENLSSSNTDKVSFEHFHGVAPHKFGRIFAINEERKKDHKVQEEWPSFYCKDSPFFDTPYDYLLCEFHVLNEIFINPKIKDINFPKSDTKALKIFKSFKKWGNSVVKKLLILKPA